MWVEKNQDQEQGLFFPFLSLNAALNLLNVSE